jgi:aspartyl-tRNA(Asn)/glutamyl-tRNA(Gln) amidotransferase subunit A
MHELIEDSRAQGRRLGRLHGVPLAHKDMFRRRGRTVGYGSRVPAFPSDGVTATVLDRLDQAGATDIGQLAMVEFAMGPHGFNSNYPPCRKPRNLSFIPCGSSSGSGVAVAAGLVHGSLGSDTGGSVRCPASANGVVGLLPTHGRVSRFGMMPGCASMDAVGPIARTVRDVAAMMDASAGPDPQDSSARSGLSTGFEAALDGPPRRLRIGLARGYFDDGLHSDTTAALEAAAETLLGRGFDVSEVHMPVELLQDVADLHPLVMKAEAAAHHAVLLRDCPDLYTPQVGTRLQAGLFIPASDYLAALRVRGRLLRDFLQVAFAQCDMLLTSTLATRIPTIADTSAATGQAYLDMVVALTRNTKVINYLGLPALSLPCGFDGNGLPIGMQLVGRPFQETDLLYGGAAYQLHSDWHTRRPPLHIDG